MRKITLAILIIGMMVGCTDQNKRMQNLKAMYPNHKIEPATGLIQNQGYSFILIDSNYQITAVSFYPFSETKIESIRNIR